MDAVCECDVVRMAARMMGEVVEFAAYVTARRVGLVRTMVLLGCPQPDAETVVQDALLRAHRSWRDVEQAVEPEGRVYTILLETLRGVRARLWNGEVPAETVPEQPETPDQRLGLTVRRALAHLGTEDRAILVLRFYAGLSDRDTAAALHVSPGRVKSGTAPALEALRLMRTLPRSATTLTPDEVRHLLAEAATTITPGPEPDVEPPPRDWRLTAASATATVVVSLAVGIVAAELQHDDGVPTPTPPGPTASTTAPGALGDSAQVPHPFGVQGLGEVPGHRSFHVGSDQIPPVTGYPAHVGRWSWGPEG